MVDRVTPEKRSAIMRSVRGKNTGPEIIVRSAAHRIGLRFRLHCKTLPGTPDMVLRGRKTVIFVNGCYWHRHENCPKAGMPKSNRRFWSKKFTENLKRDARNYSELRESGWRVIVIWQCEVKTLSDAMKLLGRKFRIPVRAN